MARSLLQKLGIKEGFRIQLINEPEEYLDLLDEPLPQNISYESDNLDFVHLFTNKLEDLELLLPQLQSNIKPTGMIWVSWYKKSAKIKTEINEDIIRDCALALKLVDIKVCSVDLKWSALKLVIRKALR